MNVAERQFWLDGKRLAGVCDRKCGLITVTVFEDEYVFQLSCYFCPSVFSCFESFVNHFKIKHPPLSLKYLKNDTDNETDREQPDELAWNSLLISDEFQKEITDEYEYEEREGSNVGSSRELLENQSNDDADFTSIFEFQNDLKVGYEEASNGNKNQDHLCNEVQENQSNDDAEFISEDEHSVESSHTTSPKVSKLYKHWNIGKRPRSREVTLDILKMWKSYPCLWGQKCDANTKKKRIEALDTIRYSLRKIWNCEISRNALLQKIRFLRTQYNRWMHSRRKATPSKDVIVPWFVKELSFLTPQTYYSCEECDKEFRSEDCFNHHKYTHDGIARYVCNDCNRKFASAVLLKSHKSTHLSVIDRPFECRVCGRKFALNTQLTTHFRRYHC